MARNNYLKKLLVVLRKAPHIWHFLTLHCSVFKEHVNVAVNSFYMLSQLIVCVNIFFYLFAAVYCGDIYIC